MSDQQGAQPSGKPDAMVTIPPDRFMKHNISQCGKKTSDSKAFENFLQKKITITQKHMEEKIISLIAAVLNVDVSKVKMNTEIGELDEWDSLRNVTIIARLEKEFEIKITPEMIMDLEDVSDIVSLVKDLKEQS